MEQTATSTTAPQPTGRFARDSPPVPEAATPPAAVIAPAADLAAVRAIERRWPRSVPPKRVFPRS